MSRDKIVITVKLECVTETKYVNYSIKYNRQYAYDTIKIRSNKMINKIIKNSYVIYSAN